MGRPGVQRSEAPQSQKDGRKSSAGLPGIPSSLAEFRKVKEDLLKSSAQLSTRQPLAPRDTG